MVTQTMSVTQLREDIFDVVKATKINKQITEITLHGEIMADLVPHVEKKKFDWDKYEKDMEEGLKYLRSVGWKENKNFRKSFKLAKW